MSPFSRRHLIALVSMVVWAGCIPPAQDLFTRSEAALRASEFARAESLFSVYLTREPADADAWYGRALARAGRVDLSGARRDLDSAIRRAPWDRDARWMRFRIREQQIAAMRADTGASYYESPLRAPLASALTVIQIEELTSMLAIDPRDAAARCERAVLYKNGGRHAEALADLQYVLREDPSNIQALTERGNVYHALGRYADAVKEYDAALAECDTCRWLLYDKALSLHAGGLFDEAVSVLDRLVVVDRDDGDAWFLLGECHMALHHPRAACAAWEKSLDLGIAEAQARLDTSYRKR